MGHSIAIEVKTSLHTAVRETPPATSQSTPPPNYISKSNSAGCAPSCVHSVWIL